MLSTSTMPPKLKSSGYTDPSKSSGQSDQCTLCWSSTLTPTSDDYYTGKAKTIRLRKLNEEQSLGFSIRGGWEHGIGFFVSDVQPNSIAAKQGLCPGDQIVRINGFPLERVIHDEVVALIRMSSNDLTLRVRSMGVVPCKTQNTNTNATNSSSDRNKLLWKRTSSLSSTRTDAIHSALDSPHMLEGSVVSSFVYSRPRSVCSLLTPSSTPSTISSEGESSHLSSDESNEPLVTVVSGAARKPPPLPVRSITNHRHHHHQQEQQLQLVSKHEDQSDVDDQDLDNSTIYCTKYTEKQIYIRAHPPGSSLGCSVVNGPPTCPGIFVQHIKEGRLAAKCGLEIGDQIVKVNNIDVSLIGFEGAITLLKTLNNFSLNIKKGVAKHIFDLCNKDVHRCENLYSVGPTVTTMTTMTECHQYQCHQQSTQTLPHHHHHRACSSPPPDYSQTTETTTCVGGQSFCSTAAATSFSSVQIAKTIGASAGSGTSTTPTCEKARCCCKRQRIKDVYLMSPGGASGLAIPPPPPPPPPPTTQIVSASSGHMCTFSGEHLDNVTSAMANSIRILQEVREKEEKLAEASRKLNEEHLKLCREKERLEHEKKELTAAKENGAMIIKPPPYPPLLNPGSSAPFNSHGTGPMMGTGTGTLGSIASNTSGPSFSFLEEIKALGIDGGKRHLRPVNSNDSRRDSSSTTASGDSDKLKLRQSPFALTNQVTKDADQRRQHELLMEEFRIAHQKMFGGLKKTGMRSVLMDDNNDDESEDRETSQVDSLTSASSLPANNHQHQSKPNLSHPAVVKARQVAEEPHHYTKKEEVKTTRASHHQPKPSMKTFPAPPPPASNAQQQAKANDNERTVTTSSSSGNRITIKVLSPKLSLVP